MSAYQAFLASKAPADPPSGFRDAPPLPSCLKPFQAAITAWALRRGRAAMFEGTGLGKTLQQLCWANAVVNHEGAPVLVLTPLAVAEQTVAEAAKFGIPGVSYAADRHSEAPITVTNYERFDKFRIEDFAGIVLDESGILKSQDGKTRAELTDACQNTPWRLCCTATPAPNDYTELGQHAEFLGVMSAKEMLSMYFVHDGSIRADDHSQTNDGWRLKRHAAREFWRWVASWSVMVRHPADLGFDDPGYDLPPLSLHQVTVAAEYRPTAGQLFPVAASTLGERIGVRKDTAAARVAAAVEIVNQAEPGPWLIWCNLNSEADAIERLIPDALQVAGRHDIETKVSRLLGFKFGTPPILVSKGSIAGHGMNWQHCNRMIFVGLTDSFESVYQSIRRCWRFGQSRPVDVYFVASELEGAVVANLRRKEQAFDAMLDAMASHMRDLIRENVTGGRVASAALQSHRTDGDTGVALTAERLREVVFYDPDTGIFTWRIDRGYRGGRGKAGQRAGSFNHTLGYRVIGIDGRTYLEPRLAVLYVSGAWPAAVVDHRRNGDGFNNQWSNLRPASRSQNAVNTEYKKPNATSVLRGVSWHRRAGKWQAHIRDAGNNIYLGLFLSEEAAHAAYREAAVRIYGEFANV